jgi:predicted GNAT family acetyltransferase
MLSTSVSENKIIMESIRLELNQRGDGAFYLMLDDKMIGKMLVGIANKDLFVYHTEAFIEGQGFAKKLMTAMVSYAREHQMRVTPYCPYVHAQFKRHPEEYADIWNKEKEKS